MPSKILFNKDTNKILRCQPKPKGSARLPSFDDICQSARIAEGEKENLDTIVVSGNILTHTAQDEYRVVKIGDEYKFIKQSKVNINLSDKELDSSKSTELTIDVEITNTIEQDSLKSIDMLVNDVEFSIDISDNKGSKTIDLQDPDTYTFKCHGDEFISNPQTVEVV